jgi:iron complex transport system substrate-binding protein
MKRTSQILLFYLLLAGCSSGESKKEDTEHLSSLSTRYASRFDFRTEDNYTLLQVFNPWQNSKRISYSYVLGEKKELVPDSLSGLPFIPTPVNRVIAMSTTHVAMIAELGEITSIKGASGTPYIYNTEIRERCENGLIADVGYGQALNYELVVALEPDVVFLYGVEGNVTTLARKLTELGITVVYCAEYLEQDPLGKAEWIRFFARFYGKENEADVFFNRVDSSYMALRTLTSSVDTKPRVMIGLPWKGTWYVAGGRSFASRLINDAGGAYIWSDNPSDEAVPMDLESVFSKAVNADVWINPGVAQSIGELLAFDHRFGELPVLTRGNIYNNDARKSPGGGNDYWESATIRPDIVLSDLISVFHPQLNRDHSMFYYRRLN